jgi:hypothetical protein
MSSSKELKPWIDGVLYDDMWPITDPETRRIMVARRVAWETEFTFDGVDFAGCVIAASRGEAEIISDARGLGEKVIGVWREAARGED